MDECLQVLEGYQTTIEGKEPRYIHLCDLRCYLFWANDDFLTAIRWGAEGVELKESTDADTKFDCAHNLALARRDAGMLDPALEYFLRGRKLTSVIEDRRPKKSLGGAYYGNIGRCLHLMGQIEPALSCYRNSAILLQESDSTLLENKAYIRQWVGEILLDKNKQDYGRAALIAAESIWEILSPAKARAVRRMIEERSNNATLQPPLTNDAAEQKWSQWMKYQAKNRSSE